MMAMNDQQSWYSRETFWDLFEPLLFNRQRQLQATDEVEKIVKLLQIEDGARICDLCCGVGRHSLALARLGYKVFGVDLTASYIKKARLEAQKNHLDITFAVDDMRTFIEPDAYGIVLNLFGSFGYFEDPEDDRQVVQHMVTSLRPGGKFLIETMGKEILAREFQERDWSQEGETLILSEKKVSENWSRIDTRWIIIRGTERIEHQVSVRSYSAAELLFLLQSCGLTEVRAYGSLEGVAYDQAAQRLVVVGCKGLAAG